jgi:pyruvate dehydrogenase E2 component (dihydrolipoamide acetyltransferase)
MDVEVKMPDLSTTESEVTIVRWLVQEGENVTRGQPLLEIETDKAVMEVESIAKGTVKSVHIPAGEKAQIGQVVAIIEKAGLPSPAAKPVEAPATIHAQRPDPVPEKKSPSKKSKGGSFFAKNKEARANKGAASVTSRELSLAQRTVARKMTESKQTIPHFYLQTSINAEPMANRRGTGSGQKLAWDAFFVSAAAKALQAFPAMCNSFESEKLIAKTTNAIGVAVGTDNELYVLPIDNPVSKSIEAISDEIRDKVNRLRSGDKDAGRLAPGTLTITNLGGANIESFIPIINPPEASILSIGKIGSVVVSDNKEIKVQDRATLVLAVDHRIVNGLYAANFLNCIVEELEKL